MSWQLCLDRRRSGYARGIYTPKEMEALAVSLMPVDQVAAVIERLPVEIVNGLRDLATESAGWSEAVWHSLVAINQREPDEAERALFRQKCQALREYFSDKRY